MENIRLKRLLTEKVFGQYQHGWDLTNIDAKDFIAILKQFNITPKSRRIKTAGGALAWEWKGKDADITVYTGNDPITGEYASKQIPRDNEKDYASYVGVEGEEEAVKEFAKLFNKKLNYKKGESPGRRIYI